MAKTATSNRILTLLRTMVVSAQLAVTTSKKYFEEVGVVWMGDSFEPQFLGLEAAEVPETELAVHKLEGGLLKNAPILTELGNKAEIPVSQFKAFLAENRGSSESFVFYLRGRDGNLWAVLAFWNAAPRRRGWGVLANSVDGQGGWNAGVQIVSRN